LEEQQAQHEDHREYRGYEQAQFQIAAGHFGNVSHQGGAYRGAQVTGQCQKGKHGGAAPGAFPGGEADGARPHDAHGKAAKGAARKAQNGQRGQGCQQIAADAQNAAQEHHLAQIQLFTEFAVEHPGDAHEHGKQTRSGQIAHGLGYAHGGFRKGRGPLAHGGFRAAGADHQQYHQPEDGRLQQAADTHAAAVFVQLLNGAADKVEGIQQRHQSPDAGEDFPVLHAECGEEEGRTQNHTHRAPAIEGMEQAHGACLVLKGAGFHDGAQQNLFQAAADGIQHNAEQNADKGHGEQLRHNGHQRQTCRRHDLGGHNACPVAEFVGELGSDQIRQQLGQVEYQGDQRDLIQGDGIGVFEGQKQQRCEIGGDGLGDKADITGYEGLFVVLLGRHDGSPSKTHNCPKVLCEGFRAVASHMVLFPLAK